MGLFDDLLQPEVSPQQTAGQPTVPQAAGGLFDDLLQVVPQPQGAARPAAPAAGDRSAPFRPLIDQAAAKYLIDPRLLSAMVDTESGFDPQAVSPVGARGLMQLMPGTAAELGVSDPFDPAQNVEGGAKYMRQLLDRYKGNTDAALAAYNWGMGNLDREGLKNAPEETRNYLERVKSRAGSGLAAKPQVDTATPELRRKSLEQELMQFERTAGGMRAPDYYNAKAEILEKYRQETGQIPDIPGLGLEEAFRGFTQGALQDPQQAVGQVLNPVRWLPEQAERKVYETFGMGPQTAAEREIAEREALERYRAAIGKEGMDIPRLVGNIISPVGLATGAAGAVPQVLARLGPRAGAIATAAMRGGAGAATSPVEVGEDDSLLGSKAAQVGVGAVAGPVFEGLARAGTAGAGRVAGAIRNVMSDDKVQALVDLSKRWGVDLLAGDYDTNRRLVRGIEGRLINTQIPGLNIDLLPQQKQGMEAAREMLAIQNKALQSTTYQSLDRVEQVAASGGKRAKEAQAVLRMVDEAGEDARRVIQASGNLKWLRMKLSADELYDEVERLAGATDVPPTSTLKTINKFMEVATDPSARPVDFSPETVSLMQRWKSGLDIAQEEGADEAATAAPNTYMRMRNFLTRVESRIKNATKPGGQDADTTWLNEVADAIRTDMDDFASSTPKLRAANNRANTFYSERVAPFKAESMAKALKSDNPDQVWSSFVRTGADWRGDVAQQKLYKALDEKGKAAVRAGMVEDAFERSTYPEGFSPTNFNKVLRETGYETFFRGPSRGELDGLMRLVDHMSRSDPAKLASFTPMIGNLSVAGAASVMSGAASPAVVAAGLASTGALKWLVTSETGRRLLYSANLYKPGSAKADQAMARILESASTQFGAAAARAGGLEAGQPGTVLP